MAYNDGVQEVRELPLQTMSAITVVKYNNLTLTTTTLPAFIIHIVV